MDDITDGKLDTAKVKAFRAPAGTLVEVYATTLHYAPCHVDPAKGFRVDVYKRQESGIRRGGFPLCG